MLRSPSRDATVRTRRSSFPSLIDPAVGHKPIDRPGDALFDREVGLPSQLPDFCGIEIDHWIVTNPAALTPAVFETRRQSEASSDPADRILYFDIPVNSQIEDVDLVIGALDGQEHRATAVLNVHV